VSQSPLHERVLRAAERSDLLDKGAKRVQHAVKLATKSTWLVDRLSGRDIGHPAHPALVQIPIGCWTSAVLLDLVGVAGYSNFGGHKRAQQLLLATGVATALPAASSGLLEWVFTEGSEQRVGSVHALANTAATLLFGISWAERVRGGSGRATAIAGTLVLGVGAWLGGHLSFRRGVGFSTTAFQSGPTEWKTVATNEEVTVGALTKVVVDGTSVAITRIASHGITKHFDVVAFDARCTHRGGPLNEGAIEGDCVRCPWHSAQFNMRTGAVLHGPASVPQPTYEVRVHDEQVAIRSSELGQIRVDIP
jgi:nitrite reductase/ring-hydroxylating ferredoxin subunit/uncharacterized membrane protein